MKKEGCDLIVGGFPCKNLTMLARTVGVGNGLEGEKSGLFYPMCNIISWISEINPNVNIVIENNASMTNNNKKKISDKLSNILDRDIYTTECDSVDYSPQTRRRLYWTTFQVKSCSKKNIFLKNIIDTKNTDNRVTSGHIKGSLNNVWKMDRDSIGEKIIENLDGTVSFKKVNIKNGKLRTFSINKLEDGKSKSIIPDYKYHIIAIPKGNGKYILRYFTINELEKLFTFPNGYTPKEISLSQARELYGNSVIVNVIECILKSLY